MPPTRRARNTSTPADPGPIPADLDLGRLYAKDLLSLCSRLNLTMTGGRDALTNTDNLPGTLSPIQDGGENVENQNDQNALELQFQQLQRQVQELLDRESPQDGLLSATQLTQEQLIVQGSPNKAIEKAASAATQGPGCYTGKTDIESAFLLIPVHPNDWELLGMFWNGQYYFDKVLPFGLRSAPYIFNQLSDAIEWILLNKCSISFVCHILDDFFIVEPPCHTPPLDSLCQASLSSMILTFKNLNIPISAAKTEGPSQIILFMGIILDSGKMEGRLPEDKVETIKSALSTFQSQRSTTLQELQSLIGTLNFACKVIPPGRPFLQRIIHLARGVKKTHHHIKLTTGFYKDIEMWKMFIDQWNGIGLFLSPLWETSDTLSTKVHSYFTWVCLRTI